MLTIYKYPLGFSESEYVSMPQGARILHVGEQRGALILWAQVQVGQHEQNEQRTFCVYGTGHPLQRDDLLYLATVQMQNGLVWHVFEFDAPRQSVPLSSQETKV